MSRSSSRSSTYRSQRVQLNEDASLAKRVIQQNSYIDAVCEQMLRELLTYMFEDPSTISRALRLIFVARNLERVGDHATNIAEMVIFLVEGQDVRHGQGLITG